MEDTVIEFLLSTFQELAGQYPDAAWISVVLGMLFSVCGVAAVVTIWLPAPSQTSGWYAALYRWLHALAGHVAQNRGAQADADAPEVKKAVRAVTGK